MGLRERRGWLFPVRQGWFRGVDLSLLDPSSEDDRALLIRAAHPELKDLIDEEDELEETEEGFNPRLHLTLHEIVAAQIWNDEPPQVGETVDRLRAAGYDRHDVQHMLASTMVEEIWRVGHMRSPYDRERHLAALNDLPDSWLASGLEDGLDDHDDEDLVDRAVAVLSRRGPLGVDELAAELGVDVGDIEELVAEPAVVALADLRLAWVPGSSPGASSPIA
jgi:hypothetical protein